MYDTLASIPGEVDWESLGLKSGTAGAIIVAALAVFQRYAKKWLDERDKRERELIDARKELQEHLVKGFKETAERFERAADRIEAAATAIERTQNNRSKP